MCEKKNETKIPHKNYKKRREREREKRIEREKLMSTKAEYNT